MHTKSITTLGHLINRTYVRSFPCIKHCKQMHSVLFEWGDICAKHCCRKSCLYLHRNCTRSLCPCETIPSVPSLSPSPPAQPRSGIFEALWAQDWNYTSAACLDATALFAQWLRALFSFLLLPSYSLSPLIFSPCPDYSGSPFFLGKPGEHSRSSLWERAGICTPLPPSSCDPAVSSHREECMERVEENTKFSTDHLIKYQHRNPVQTVYVFCINLQQPEAGLQLDPV